MQANDTEKGGGSYRTMGDGCMAEHLGRYVALSAHEREALDRLTAGTCQYKRGAVIRADHGPPGEIMVVTSGWIFCSAMLEDGRRQIVRLHFRGDMIGLDSLAFPAATDAVVALTDADVCIIDRAALGQLFADHPRLGALLYAVQQVDRVTLMERLVSLGRSSAAGRVAALLTWIAARLRFADMATDDGFALPLTQEEMGDLTGLTAVHVNRTMRVLADQRLIQRSGNRLHILDAERLARVAGLSPRAAAINTSWLPPARA